MYDVYTQQILPLTAHAILLFSKQANKHMNKTYIIYGDDIVSNYTIDSRELQ